MQTNLPKIFLLKQLISFKTKIDFKQTNDQFYALLRLQLIYKSYECNQTYPTIF